MVASIGGGSGDYIASAVLCFAFDRLSILMDTNTMRIAHRIMGGSNGLVGDFASLYIRWLVLRVPKRN